MEKVIKKTKRTTIKHLHLGDINHPEYKKGDMLAIKQTPNLDMIQWGEAYLIVTKQGEMKIRRVHPAKSRDEIILKADNFPELRIRKSDIKEMSIIVGSIKVTYPRA